MGKILYLECNSGISGNMTVGVLLDLEADRQVLGNALESLRADEYHLHLERKVVNGLDTFDFDVHLEEHEHGYEEDHGHEEGHWHEEGRRHEDGRGHEHERGHEDGHRREAGHGCEVGHGHEHEHSHETDHGHEHEHSHKAGHGHPYPHVHRDLHDIYHIMDRLDSNERVREMARTMFRIMIEAESKTHGLPVEQVHFYEVGAIDFIVDIISAAVCIDNLGVEDVMVSTLSEGHGHIYCQHSVLPVPVPATANIASSYEPKLHFTDNDGEVVIPTGAAIAAALRIKGRLPSSCRLLKVGMGTENKVFKQANVLRAMLLEISQEEDHTMQVLETNLDDCTGEMLDLAMEMLLDAGTADVWYTPIHMKKNRPVYMPSVLCHESSIEAMEEIILTWTTTIGIHRYPTERTILDRSEIQVETSYGPADVKVCAYRGGTFFYPEYENVRRIYREQGVDFQAAYHQARMKAEESRQD